MGCERVPVWPMARQACTSPLPARGACLESCARVSVYVILGVCHVPVALQACKSLAMVLGWCLPCFQPQGFRGPQLTRSLCLLARQSNVQACGIAGEVVHGQAAVVTVPLGVLQAGSIAFDPALPPWKQEAVQALGYGNLNKVGHLPCCMLSLFVAGALPPGVLQAECIPFKPALPFWKQEAVLALDCGNFNKAGAVGHACCMLCPSAGRGVARSALVRVPGAHHCARYGCLGSRSCCFLASAALTRREGLTCCLTPGAGVASSISLLCPSLSRVLGSPDQEAMNFDAGLSLAQYGRSVNCWHACTCGR